jgi:hypothetical protein
MQSNQSNPIKEKIIALLLRTKEDVIYGGYEDDNGDLQRYDVDFDELIKEVEKIFSASEE